MGVEESTNYRAGVYLLPWLKNAFSRQKINESNEKRIMRYSVVQLSYVRFIVTKSNESILLTWKEEMQNKEDGKPPRKKGKKKQRKQGGASGEGTERDGKREISDWTHQPK